MLRLLLRLLITLFFILGLAYVAVCQLGQKIVFFGAHLGNTKWLTVADAMPELGLENISFTTADGTTLHGWLLNRGQGAPLVAIYGGNNMNVGNFADLTTLASRSSFLLLNHRGYGMSEGTPSEKVVIDDARQALRHYRRVLGNPRQVTLIGFSLGTGVATQVAATEPVNHLILACPFDSVLATGCQHVPLLPKLIPMDHFRSDLAAPKVRCPVTIFMGTQDTIVPNERTLSLIPCFRNTHVQLHRIDSGHNEIFKHRETQEVIQAVLARLER